MDELIQRIYRYTYIYLGFLNECTEPSTDNIKSVDLYNRFKNWFKNNNPGHIIPTQRKFSLELKKHVQIEKIHFDGVGTSGIKNLQLKD
jgi:hypothetical protein